VELCERLLNARTIRIYVFGIPCWRFKTKLEHVLALSLRQRAGD